MPSQYALNSGGPAHGEILLVRPRTSAGVKLDTIASTGTNYIVDLPPGCYMMAMTVNASLTGTSTVISDILPFLDEEQSVVAAAALVSNQRFRLLDGGIATTPTATVTFTAGAGGGRYFVLTPNTGTAQPRDIPLMRGFRFKLTKGGATEGERFHVTVVAYRR